MSIENAIIDKFLSLAPEDSVENALKSLKKAKVEAAPVTDEQGRLLGIFSLQALMKNLLPVSVPMNDGIVLDIKVRAAPGIAKRLDRRWWLLTRKRRRL
jgi:predicted transcriptional regulator